MYGEKLIDFAIATKMRILNGRALGDFIGKLTYIGYTGVSPVDYVLASCFDERLHSLFQSQ